MSDDRFWITSQITKLKRLVRKQHPSLVITELEANTANIVYLINNLQQTNMFASENCFFLKNAEDCRFFQAKKLKTSERELSKQLCAVLQSNTNHYCYFFASGQQEVLNSPLGSFFADQKWLLYQPKWTEQAKKQFIYQFNKQAQLALTPAEINTFINNTPLNRGYVMNELKKIVLLREQKDKLATFVPFWETSIFKLSDAFCANNPQLFLAQWTKLANQNLQASQILGLLASQLIKKRALILANEDQQKKLTKALFLEYNLYTLNTKIKKIITLMQQNLESSVLSHDFLIVILLQTLTGDNIEKIQ